MKRNNALSIPRKLKPTLVQQFGVNQLALFGSTSRDDARDNSDVDILVRFDGPATSTRHFGVHFYLEDQPGCQVDLVPTERYIQSCVHLLKRTPSMSDALAREWRFYSNDMIVFAEKVLGYTVDFDRQLPLYFLQ